MYENFYNFTEKPFNTTPDSRFFFPSPKHTEALNSLIYAINERKGFVVITGEIGAGKTTVYRTMLNKLDINTKTAVITNTHLTPKELICEILDELEIEYKSGTKQKLISQLNAYLIQQLSADINVVLIIDEAQNLSPKTLEEVRMLSNLETEREKLIQIILIGQPQLKAKLENPKLEQFKQRIAVYYHIPSLNQQETEEYIMHRLKLVSPDGSYEQIFTKSALEAIYTHSRGIPRLINLIADSALLSGYIYEQRQIDERIIQDVIKERDFSHQNADVSHIVVSSQYENSHIPKIYCCLDCQYYSTCETKWFRGINGEEQLCCAKCNNYHYCLKKVVTLKDKATVQ
ncbi:MAG: AAA family ATPase [Candidatus Omnitrophica bacterium]|nr:AAA family ATPase [Candidatus Omnitrophota bacterium]